MGWLGLGWVRVGTDLVKLSITNIIKKYNECRTEKLSLKEMSYRTIVITTNVIQNKYYYNKCHSEQILLKEMSF